MVKLFSVWYMAMVLSGALRGSLCLGFGYKYTWICYFIISSSPLLATSFPPPLPSLLPSPFTLPPPPPPFFSPHNSSPPNQPPINPLTTFYSISPPNPTQIYLKLSLYDIRTTDLHCKCLYTNGNVMVKGD